MPALALSLLGFGKSAMSFVWAFLSKLSPSQLGCIVLSIVAVVAVMRANHWKGVATERQASLVACQKARAADRASYTTAQKQAATKNDAQVAHIKQQQQEITDATVSRLNSRLELIRSELRAQSAATPSAPAGPKAGDASPPPCTVNDPSWMCLSPADRLRAAENEERHDELIDWALGQAAIDPNKP